VSSSSSTARPITWAGTTPWRGGSSPTATCTRCHVDDNAADQIRSRAPGGDAHDHRDSRVVRCRTLLPAHPPASDPNSAYGSPGRDLGDHLLDRLGQRWHLGGLVGAHPAVRRRSARPGQRSGRRTDPATAAPHQPIARNPRERTRQRRICTSTKNTGAHPEWTARRDLDAGTARATRSQLPATSAQRLRAARHPCTQHERRATATSSQPATATAWRLNPAADFGRESRRPRA
jgi:hypothetical protein